MVLNESDLLEAVDEIFSRFIMDGGDIETVKDEIREVARTIAKTAYADGYFDGVESVSNPAK